LIRPSEGCINTSNVIPTATALMSTGKKMIDRSAERRWILDVRSVASKRPRMTFEPLVTTAYTNVLRRPLVSESSCRNSPKLSRPMNVESNNVQRVRL
jgi:hypothetical protein